MRKFSRFLNAVKVYIANLKKIIIKNKKNKFIFFDLSPTNNADINGVYRRALDEAMRNVNVHNIALTGPYGSGKTSIIKTFEKNSTYKLLNISLATFSSPKVMGVSCGISDEQNNLIERSILQQMFYGAGSGNLQYSRFKRISAPENPELKALIFTAWLLLCIFSYSKKDWILQNIDFSTSTSALIFILLFMFSTLAHVLSLIYKATYSYSIKKLSLNNGEVEVGEISADSVLNRHLDEIIYFFDVTRYDLVVIEDLDRFGSPEIFIKLREINKIINDRRVNSLFFLRRNRIKQPLKFLYAIKDDMFDGKSRAKFFDFIIPVLPVINRSNSKEKIISRLRDTNYAYLIDSSFAREVSLYIDDMRLVNNIINELIIYDLKIGSDSLNRIKLFAIVIYKNIYPNDFEKLHYGEGALHSVCERRPSLIRNLKADIEAEIVSIRAALTASKYEALNSIEEIIKIFQAHLYAYDRGRVLTGVYVDERIISLDEMLQWETFEQLIALKNITLEYQHNNYDRYNYYERHVSLGKSFVMIQEEISPNITFKERKHLIENKSKFKKQDFINRLDELTEELSYISKMSLSELINRSGYKIGDDLASGGVSNPDLLVYLLGNGYLDETYYLYTSNFHEGSMSKRDRDYLLAIRGFKIPDPAHLIDTPIEVCNEMRLEDFEQEYVLNVRLIDYLMTADNHHRKKIISAVKFISKNFIKSNDFFSEYWAAGERLGILTNIISEHWPDYGSVVLRSDYAAEHVAAIISYVNPDYIEEKMNGDELLTEYISNNSYAVFSVGHVPHSNYKALKNLCVKIADLSDLLGFTELIDYIHSNDLYELSIDNIKFIFELFNRSESISELNIDSANYTAIRDYGSVELNRYIEKNLSFYIDKVFLRIPENSEESGAYIENILNSHDLTNEQKQYVISKQNFIFPSLDGVPQTLWEFILLSDKLEVSWHNIIQCFNCNECDNESITKILNKNYVIDILSLESISKEIFGEDLSLKISRFILNNEDITDQNYNKLCGLLSHNFRSFPEGVSTEKCISLIDAGVVALNETSFDFSGKNKNIRLRLISNNLKEYENNRSKYKIEDETKEILIFSNIDEAYKKRLSTDISSGAVRESGRLINFISNILILPDAKINDWDDKVISICIVNHENLKDSILIFSKVISYFAKDLVVEILSRLPEPYSAISVYGKRPRLLANPENIVLADQLKEQGIISSIKHEVDYIRIITFNS